MGSRDIRRTVFEFARRGTSSSEISTLRFADPSVETTSAPRYVKWDSTARPNAAANDSDHGLLNNKVAAPHYMAHLENVYGDNLPDEWVDSLRMTTVTNVSFRVQGLNCLIR
ncbi:uncharacterized protein BDW47DRAFT_23763 [Aspergillus candidus]|uniref:Uncharacterized protein n=1 Tax=Aspergillus candidus TaxID=41067 RepID=A0A2I2FD23_ASPCN|nr:hypothetical protein BDW47DRAFT_23763 [Aspergillus candidus]PLB38528.1 hypothetical protein BDW47DRAFT_23763 [Aspergillus candidus]